MNTLQLHVMHLSIWWPTIVKYPCTFTPFCIIITHLHIYACTTASLYDDILLYVHLENIDFKPSFRWYIYVKYISPCRTKFNPVNSTDTAQIVGFVFVPRCPVYFDTSIKMRNKRELDVPDFGINVIRTRTKNY